MSFLSIGFRQIVHRAFRPKLVGVGDTCAQISAVVKKRTSHEAGHLCRLRFTPIVPGPDRLYDKVHRGAPSDPECPCRSDCKLFSFRARLCSFLVRRTCRMHACAHILPETLHARTLFAGCSADAPADTSVNSFDRKCPRSFPSRNQSFPWMVAMGCNNCRAKLSLLQQICVSRSFSLGPHAQRRGSTTPADHIS